MINKVILVGNVGMDPEVRTLESGVKVARVRLATTERLYNREKQESTEHTEWHTIVLWRNLADVTDKYVRKGSQLYIEGRLRTREWTDQQGAKRYSVEILADDMKLLGRRTDNPAAATNSSSSASFTPPQTGSASDYSARANRPAAVPEVPVDDDPDDLPF